MTSAKISDFLTPSPLVTNRNQLILFLSSACWGPSIPHAVRTSYKYGPFRRRLVVGTAAAGAADDSALILLSGAAAAVFPFGAATAGTLLKIWPYSKIFDIRM